MKNAHPSTEREPGTLGRLYSLILPYRTTVAAGLACLILSVAAELYPPLVWQQVVDIGLAQRDWTYIGWQLAVLVLVFGLGQVCSAVRGVLLERAGQQLTLDLRLRMHAKLQSQSAAYFAQRRTGDLLARLTADVESVQDVLIRGTDSVVANALRVFGVAAIFIALQPALGLIVLLPMLLVGLLLMRYNRRVRPVYRAARRRLGELSAQISDNINGVRVIQAFAQDRRVAAALERIGRELYGQQEIGRAHV